MANEKRLIDANDMLKQFSDYMQKLKCYDEYRDGLYRGMEIAESMIKEAPTVDAVEVVYCKDCKHCFHDSKLLAGLVDGVYVCGVWGKGLPRMKPNDFCSYGERRERE